MALSITALVAMYTMVGVGTTYLAPPPQRAPAPLFCSTPDHPLYYDDATPPWVALPVSADWQCWDLILVREHLADGTTRSMMAYALDAGPFGDHCVVQADGSCPPIVVDAPTGTALWPGLSSEGHVEVVNLSAVARECQERGMCDGYSDSR